MNQGHFPKTHLVLVAVLSLGLCSFVLAKFNDTTQERRFSTADVLATLPATAEPTTAEAEKLIAEAPVEPAAKPEPPSQPMATAPARETSHTIKQGDSLAVIFKKSGISSKVLHQLTHTKPLGQQLDDIFPGHEIRMGFHEDGTLTHFYYTPGPLLTLEFARNGESWDARELRREPEKRVAYRNGQIEHSLFVASQRVGMSEALTMELAHIFQWDIDFVLDIRSGDSFFLLYEEEYLDGEHIGYGDILAAEFVNQGKSYRAVLYEDEMGQVSYFDPEGRNMRKAFLRAPVEFSRISSNFNLRRVHPLFKRTMPHRGIDYAAPPGTPILAAGDGKVRIADRTKANGNYVVLQHGEQFQTKYLHLSRFANGVRSGSRVMQGDIIGYVGSTGYATGPHLHYEFLVNGVHKNPRTVKLPDAEPVSKEEQARFESYAEPLWAKLTEYKQNNQLAAAR